MKKILSLGLDGVMALSMIPTLMDLSLMLLIVSWQMAGMEKNGTHFTIKIQI